MFKELNGPNNSDSNSVLEEQKVTTISTAHLTPKQLIELKHVIDQQEVGGYHNSWGFMLPVETITSAGYGNLNTIMSALRSSGFAWVRFDADAPIHEKFKIYEHE